jgi:outer membrane protein OmpA-like peptidoglycan-associated protein
MKRIILIVTLVTAVLGVNAQVRRVATDVQPVQTPSGVRQTRIASGIPEVRFENAESFVRGDTLFVSFDVTVIGKIISSGEALHIVPVYRTSHDELRFPGVLFNGKKRAKYYRREQALLSHEAYWARKPYAEVTLDGRRQETVSYRLTEPLPAGISEIGTLSLEQYVEDCCDLRLAGIQALPLRVVETAPPVEEPVVTRPVYEGSVTFIRPKKEVVKERNEILTLRINFIVDRHDVLPNYANNAAELKKADDLLGLLSGKGETYRVTSASIRGYASPEAPYDYNLKLSQRRADSFKQYLASKYGLSNLPEFSAKGMGEDWDGLRLAVEQSHMPYKQEVLSIIDGVGIFNGREKKLMDLAGGDPYRHMLRVLYPPLRRMEMEVAYVVRSFETVEAEGLIDERPQDLSQEEIYEVARKRGAERAARDDRDEYGREYDVAAKYFPDDATANINASSAALVRGDLDEAWQYLSKIQDVPEAYNNLGVYYWLRGDTERAERYFRLAMNVKGDEEKARRNLEQLRASKTGK